MLEFDVLLIIGELCDWVGLCCDYVFLVFDVVIEIVLVEGNLLLEKMVILCQLVFVMCVSDMELMVLMVMKGYVWNVIGSGLCGGVGNGYVLLYCFIGGLDFYVVFGVQCDVDECVIKCVYCKLIFEYYFDCFGDLFEDMCKCVEMWVSEINVVYECIKVEKGFK